MPEKSEKVVPLPRQQMRAAFVPSTFNEQARTVEIVWTTGARVLRFGWDIGYYYEELAIEPSAIRMDRLNNGAPVLNTHSSYSLDDVIGVVERAWIESGEGKAIIRFSEREDVSDIIADVKAGILRNISVGYAIHRQEQVDSADEQYPVYRAVDWEPFELSLVPIPADAGAQVRSAATAERQAPITNCVFVQRGAAAVKGDVMDPKELEQRKADDNKAAQDADVKQREAEQAAAREEGAKAERQRQAEIRTIVRALPEGEREAVAQELIDGGKTVEQARQAVLEKLVAGQTEQRSHVRVDTVEDARDKWVRGVEASIVQRAGLSQLFRQAFGSNYQVEPGEFRGMRLLDIARDSLERNGVRARGMSQMELVGAAFMGRGYITQSTSDFAVALENVMHKTLQAAYMTAPDTWSRFCRRSTVSDFRAHNRYRMGMFGALDQVNENGEFTRKPISDAEKEVIAAKTYGNIINLSRQAIINDDMGVFGDIAVRLGRAARLTIEVGVYQRLAENGGMGPTMNDGNPLFHASHNNIAASAAYPSVAAFDAARVQMAQQKDPWGNEYLDLRPSIWLGPLTFGGHVRVLNENQYDPDVTGKFQVANKVRGLLNEVVDTPRLSGTAWYMFADPSVAPVLEVAFLEGEESPVLESQDGWNVDGTEWKVRLDFGIAAVDFRGAVRNAGSSNPS